MVSTKLREMFDTFRRHLRATNKVSKMQVTHFQWLI